MLIIRDWKEGKPGVEPIMDDGERDFTAGPFGWYLGGVGHFEKKYRENQKTGIGSRS
ncbi:MAG: hypothetical protein HFI33_10600 [Lachnospiraceae bacterium]|nr:hypothetical protein [Lachnospiraceae bacterium]